MVAALFEHTANKWSCKLSLHANSLKRQNANHNRPSFQPRNRSCWESENVLREGERERLVPSGDTAHARRPKDTGRRASHMVARLLRRPPRANARKTRKKRSMWVRLNIYTPKRNLNKFLQHAFCFLLLFFCIIACGPFPPSHCCSIELL